jgi:hypothetical protein
MSSEVLLGGGAESSINAETETETAPVKRAAKPNPKLRWIEAVDTIKKNLARPSFFDSSGRFTGRRLNFPSRRMAELFVTVLTMPFAKLVVVYVGLLVVFSLACAGLYAAAGHGLEPEPRDFLDLFLHSMTVFLDLESPFEVATDGARRAHFAYLIFLLQGTIRTFALSVLVGVIIERFSRSEPGVRFSEKMLVTGMPDGGSVVTFRILSEQTNVLLDASVEVSTIGQLPAIGGGPILTRLIPVKVENPTKPFFQVTWHIRMVSTPGSPWHGMTPGCFRDAKYGDTYIKFSAFDPALEKNVHIIKKYTPLDMDWDREFVDCINMNAEVPTVDAAPFDDTVPIGSRR